VTALVLLRLRKGKIKLVHVLHPYKQHAQKEAIARLRRPKLAEMGGSCHLPSLRQAGCMRAFRPLPVCQPVRIRAVQKWCCYLAVCRHQFDQNLCSAKAQKTRSANHSIRKIESTHLGWDSMPFHSINLPKKGLFALVFCIRWQMRSCSSAFTRCPVHHTLQECSYK
jgi:hypothetical protein